MNNNTTNKKKLELKKTAIANLTLSDAQLRLVMGGVEMSGDVYCHSVVVTASELGGADSCTSTSFPMHQK